MSAILANMFIIIALGNVGQKYEKTRHNTGWIIVDEIFKNEAWEYNKYFNAEVVEDHHSNLIVKPHTMMNCSGDAVKIALQQYPEATSDNVIVLHDDVDIALGSFKIAYDRGDGNHRGVASITEALGTSAYIRIRIGIGHHGLIPMDKYVLMNMSEDDLAILNTIASRIGEALNILVIDGKEKAMNIYNTN